MILYRGQVVEKWSEDVEGFTIYRIRILEPLGTERIWNSRNFHEKVEVNEWYEFESNKTMLYKPKKIKPIKAHQRTHTKTYQKKRKQNILNM